MPPVTSAFDPATGCYLKREVFEFGAGRLDVRSLRDHDQYADPDGEAERLGISSAMWPIAGLIWSSGHALAHLVAELPLDGLRILEVGCGIGLASLVARQRDADISATDRHPLVGPLLERNARANALDPISYGRADWIHPQGPARGFDLIICGDLLYEQQHAAQLAGFIDHHARTAGVVMMMAPQRGYRGRFVRAMAARGYGSTREAAAPTVFEGQPYSGVLLTLQRPG